MDRLANGTTIALIVQKTYWKGEIDDDIVGLILDETNQAVCQKMALRDETKELLHTLQMYLDCHKKMDAKYLEIDEFQVIAKFSVSSDSNDIVDTKRRHSFKKKYQQQRVHGLHVRTLNDLYKAAERATPVFQEQVNGIVCLIREKLNPPKRCCYQVCETKSRDRSSSKAKDDYSSRDPGPSISWLFDIVRESVEFT